MGGDSRRKEIVSIARGVEIRKRTRTDAFRGQVYHRGKSQKGGRTQIVRSTFGLSRNSTVAILNHCIKAPTRRRKIPKMKTKTLVACLASALLAQFSSFGQGALTPPGGPAPTMKTLSQIEPRTPISSAPFTIN